jgi:hypothetical protein
MEPWEYLVIHINVEPPKPAAPGAAADSPAAEAPGSRDGGNARVFSESFLKQEFPHLYQGGAGQGAASPPQHPAQQLQGFLNGQGSQGWELIGVFPVGMLSMMMFRRKKQEQPQAAPKAPEQADTAAAAKGEGEGSLEALVSRLEALERRLPHEPAAPLQEATAPINRDADPVSPAQLASLATEPAVPSSRAAQAIGLRSATSLANHGARYGYQPGLRKTGPNGLVAVYTGTAAAQSGGKDRRLWIVVSAEHLANGSSAN